MSGFATSPYRADDIGPPRSYAEAMERGQPFIRLKLDIDDAIELGAFVGAFLSLASEYDRFMRAERPGEAPDATLYVKEIRAGCIEADLIPWTQGLLAAGVVAAAGGVAFLGGLNTLDEFVTRLGDRLRTYTKPGGRLKGVTKGELKDFGQQVQAIANAPGSTLRVAAIQIADGKQITTAKFEFTAVEAREIELRVEEHKRELDHSDRADYERVLMTFIRSDVRDATVSKRSGELVAITAISERPRPLIYASAMAQQQIKHEITTDDSVYKKGFVVDVNVEMRGGKPIAYAVTNLHQVIDIPDDDGE